MIDGRNVLDQPVKINLITYDKIRKLPARLGNGYTTGGLLDYNYFNNDYKMMATDLSKQQALDADPKAIQQINLIANLDRDGSTAMFFIIAEAKKTDFSQETVKALWISSYA